MNRPPAVPGLVVRYDFLWSDEAAAGRETSKDRPALVALVVVLDAGQTVGLLPITHRPPTDDDLAVEIPASEKARLGLDHVPSWIVTTEINIDIWPEGIVPVPGNGRPAYGMLSRGVVSRVLKNLATARQRRTLRTTGRG